MQHTVFVILCLVFSSLAWCEISEGWLSIFCPQNWVSNGTTGDNCSLQKPEKIETYFIYSTTMGNNFNIKYGALGLKQGLWTCQIGKCFVASMDFGVSNVVFTVSDNDCLNLNNYCGPG